MATSTVIPVGQTQAFETDFLIAGVGVAGASLASFLADYGLTGLATSAANGTAKQPRAHITNLGALDALRDIGLIEECERLGYSSRYLSNYRWSDSMAGEEYGRVYSWGYDPKRSGEYAAASPNRHLELNQIKLEPMLVKFATDRGFTVRFDTELLRFEETEDGKIRCLLKDKISGAGYDVLTKYLFGADGGRSIVAKQLKLEFDSKSPGGFAWNLVVKADLAHLMKSRPGNLHWTLRWRPVNTWRVGEWSSPMIVGWCQ
jgi:2-polyprenyl-6-methoxyphenol hydroxylase-like FAD-dependent oxidoreductase